MIDAAPGPAPHLAGATRMAAGLFQNTLFPTYARPTFHRPGGQSEISSRAFFLGAPAVFLEAFVLLSEDRRHA